MQGHLYLFVYTFVIDWWCHNVLTYSLFSVSAWSYIDLEFTTTQKILSLNIPIRNVILIKSSYDNFSQTHFFALLESWLKYAPFGAPVTLEMSLLS